MMCSVLDNEEGAPELLEKHDESISDRSCMKCGQPTVVFARMKDPFCSDCFYVYFTHRFRAMFGRSKLIRSGDKVLLAFSGGLSSSVLLSVVKEGLSKSTHRKLRFVPSVLIIDEGAFHSHSWEDRSQFLAESVAVALRVGFPVMFTRIEQVFSTYQAYNVEDYYTELHCHRGPSMGVVSQSEQELQPKDGPDEGHHAWNGPHHGEEVVVEASKDLGTCEVTPSDTNMGTDVQQAVINVDMPTGRDGGSLDQSSMEMPVEVLYDHSHVTKSADAFELDTQNVTYQFPLLEHTIAKLKDVLGTVGKDVMLSNQMTRLAESATSATAKGSLLLSLRHQLLVEVARSSGFPNVLLGDCATSLAVRLIGNVAQGRGGTLPLDIGFSDDRFKGVVIFRPLREFPEKEIESYAELFNVQYRQEPTVPLVNSIESLTRNFITHLQANFPSTVNTIFRTGDKLSLDRAVTSAEGVCRLCQAPLSKGADRFILAHLQLSSCILAGAVGDTSNNAQRLVPEEVWTSLCYGCQLTVKDMRTALEPLPPFMMDRHDSR